MGWKTNASWSRGINFKARWGFPDHDETRTYIKTCISASTRPSLSTNKCVMWDSCIVAEGQKTVTLLNRVNVNWNQVTGYWVPITNIVQCFLALVFLFTSGRPRSLMFVFHFVYHYLPAFSPSPSRNLHPRGQNTLLSFYPFWYAFSFISRRVPNFFPSSTTVGMCLPTLLSALGNWCLWIN